jgi:Tfp pilus assembly protein PilN
MSSINFLPDDEKGREKLEKKVRTIEYTQPEESAKQQKKSSHGGVLSIFKRSSDDFPKAPKAPILPPKPGIKSQITEPIIKSHNDIKKVEPRTVIAYKKTDTKKKVKPAKEKKSSFDWLKNMFSRSKKAPIVHPASVPQPPKPSYTGSQDQKIDTAPSKLPGAGISMGKKEAIDFESKVVRESAPKTSVASGLSQPPPRFNPFTITPPKTQDIAKTSDKPQKAPQPLTPIQAAPEPKEPEMTEAQIDTRPRALGMSFDVNLVPDEMVQRKQTMSRLTLLGVVVLITAFVCVVLYGVLAFYKTNVSSNVVSVQEETSRVQQQIDALTPIQRDALVLEKRTEEIQKLLDSQIHWTKLFDALEKYTMKNVTLLKVSAQPDGQVSIQGEAPDVATAFEQIAVFQNATDFVQSLSIQTTPSIPERATANTVPSESIFTFPSENAPGTTFVPTSNFSVQVQLVADYLISAQE